MKPRIKLMIWYIRKQRTTNENNKKTEWKKKKKNEDSVSSLRDNFKHSNILIIGIPEGEEKEQEIGNLFEEIMKQNFCISIKEIDMQVQEAQKVPHKIDVQRPTPRQIIIKMPKVKVKERILKAAREKHIITYKRVP